MKRFFLLCLPFVALLVAVSTPVLAQEPLHSSSYIVLYRTDAQPGSRNSQPIRLKADQISAALSRVRARSGGTGKIIELFPKENREEAAKVLSKEFRKTDANHEFHFISFRHVGNFFSISRYATSARVFVENGRLNLIFGQIDRFHSEFRDPNFKSLPPMGSRKQAASLKGSILPGPGITFVQGRHDWVALDLVHARTPPPPPTVEEFYPAPTAMERAPQAPSEKTQTAVPQPRVKRSLEERFRILKELRDKNLITQQEYVHKKQELLNSL